MMDDVLYDLERPALGQVSFGSRLRSKPRVAVVHDWLVTFAGAEKVLEEILALFPQAELFSVVDFLNEADRGRLAGRRARTSFVQKLPFARRKYRAYLAFMPLAIEQFDLAGFDLVISSSHAVAKGVLTGPDQVHICYCHTPIRYAWDLQAQYLREAGLVSGVRSLIARALLHYVRLWDVRTASGVDYFIANSAYIARRIRKVYRRDAVVIHPPVDTDRFLLRRDKDAFYLTASRLVPYKRVELIVQAFAGMPGRRLLVVGDGPDFAKIKASAPANVTMLGFLPPAALRDHLQRARAFLFAAEEDFGILPVEAQACGTPVIAYGRGGALETIVDADNVAGEAPTGLFFYEQSAAAIVDAVERFEKLIIAPEACRARAERFGRSAFAAALRGFVEQVI
jgi:glycosyltransferase involved in cell wall biosynthesis